MSRATVYDFRDLDVMLKIGVEGDQDGWVETAYLAQALGLGDEARLIASRLSWMRRFGMLEYDAERKLWRLSQGGERVTQARLRAAQSRTLEALPDEAMVDVMANVTSRYRHGGGMVAQMIRREFVYGTRPL